MGYQALLFCPDEKTARTVTQVLSELDFTVIPCTEPFGAVKKLMAEHFDAVVVDCDNEQNATLLFKSARNTPNNQSALAVAVVEGQAGVAKAFRIGANLVLTKPINVEQSKGTLRVARGLLRKNEAGKPTAPATGAAVKPAAAAPVPAKPAPPKPAPQAPNTRVATSRPAPPVAPVAPLVKAATASIPTPKPAPPPTVVASVPSDSTDADAEILEVDEQTIAPSIAKPTIKVEAATSHSGVLASTPSLGLSPANSAGFGSGAASAPAPAREPKPSVSTEDKPSAAVSEPDSKPVKVADLGENAPPIDGTSAAAAATAPSFTFGGNVSSSVGSAGGGSKKALLAVLTVLLGLAGGYAVWMQWVSSSGAATPFTHVAAPPVTRPVVPHVAPNSAPVVPSAAPSAATSSTQAPAPDSANAPPQGAVEQTSSDTQIRDTQTRDTQSRASAESAPVHPGKVSAKTDSAKPAASAPSADKTAAAKAVAQPIVIKNDLSQKPAAKPAPTSDAPAPSMSSIAPADNGGSLPNLMGGQSSAPTPVLQMLNISQGVSQGLLVKKTQPIYPANALRMHVEGTVELMATVSKNGNIAAVKILSGDPQLARAAVDAVKQWKYKPYLLNGDPVEIQTQVTMNFKLPN
jgi:TonB family protein